jgi:tyrosine-protein kinase Etk/Wzc
MTDTPQSSPASDGRGDSLAESLFGFLAVVVKHRRLISRFVAVVTVATVVVALLLPKWYKSTASVFPAEKADLFGGLEGIASLAKSFSPSKALSSLGSNPELDRYTAILKSGRVTGALIEKFDLVHVYEITSYPGEKTAKELAGNTDITVEPEGSLTISVFDRDPQRAADMANYYVEMLNKVNTEIQVANAHGNRAFIEERYKKNIEDLRKAEDSLRVYQKKYGVIALPEQTQASIKGAAELLGQLSLKEIQLGVLRRTLSGKNPSIDAAQIEVEEIQKKMSELNSGIGLGEGESKVFIPLSKVPDLGAEYIRRFRDVEIQYKILQFVTPLYEQAKVEEQRQTPSVIVLDSASPAERKAKPKIALYGLTALVISFIFSLALALFMEFTGKLRASNPSAFDGMMNDTRRDWFGLRWRRKG